MGWQVDKTWTSDPKKQGKELIFICYLRSTPNSRAGPEHQVGFQPSVLIPGTPWNLLDMEISQAGQRCDDIPHIPCPSHSARRDQRDPVDEPPKLSVIVQLMRGFRHLRTSWLYVACRLFSSYLYIYIYICCCLCFSFQGNHPEKCYSLIMIETDWNRQNDSFIEFSLCLDCQVLPVRTLHTFFCWNSATRIPIMYQRGSFKEMLPVVKWFQCLQSPNHFHPSPGDSCLPTNKKSLLLSTSTFRLLCERFQKIHITDPTFLRVGAWLFFYSQPCISLLSLLS